MAAEVARNHEFEWSALDNHHPSVPTARTYFTMCSYAGKLWTFGGFAQASGRFKDIRSYDPKTRVWKLESKEDKAYPHPVYLHTAVVYQGKMWVFGGSTESNPTDVYSFSFEARKWRNVTARMKLPTVPPPRFGHAATICGTRMIVAGGCKQGNQFHSDAWAFDLEQHRWSQLPNLPWAMAYHSLFEHQGRVFLVGGSNGQRFLDNIYRLDEDQREWTVQPCTGAVPSARCGVGLVNSGSHLYVCQGFTANGHTDDLYRLDLNTWVWERLHARNPPVCRAYLQAAIVGDELYIFGGFDGQSCVADFRSLKLPQPNIAEVLLSQDLSADQKLGKMLELVTGNPQHVGAISREQLMQLLLNFQARLPEQLQAAAGGGGGGGGEDAQYPFDLAIVPQAAEFGFERDVVIATMEQLHKEGQDPTNMNILIERLLTSPAQPSPRQQQQPPQIVVQRDPELEREVVALRQQVQTVEEDRQRLQQRFEVVQEERDEQRKCKLCLDRIMDSILLPCKHLALCHTCCSDITKRKQDCPICRKPVQRHMRVYWG